MARPVFQMSRKNLLVAAVSTLELIAGGLSPEPRTGRIPFDRYHPEPVLILVQQLHSGLRSHVIASNRFRAHRAEQRQLNAGIFDVYA